jgi:hypothetical protein
MVKGNQESLQVELQQTIIQAFDILQRDTTLKASIRGKRKLCGWNEAAFEKLIAGFSEN